MKATTAALGDGTVTNSPLQGILQLGSGAGRLSGDGGGGGGRGTQTGVLGELLTAGTRLVLGMCVFSRPDTVRVCCAFYLLTYV